jgi:hypothetical protein
MGIATAPFAGGGDDSVPVDERTSGWTAWGLLILGIGAWDFGAGTTLFGSTTPVFIGRGT